MVVRLSLFVVGVELLLSAGVPCAGQESNPPETALKVAAVCMNAKTDKEANLQTFTYYIAEAARQGAHLIVFPEIALQQNPAWGASYYQPTQAEMDYVRDTAETIPGPSTDQVVEVAATHKIFVVFGMTEKSDDGDLYNASVFLGPNGVLGKYRKRKLADASVGMNEHLVYQRGSDSGLIMSPLGNVGLVICAEMLGNFASDLAQEGADFLVTVAAWPSQGSSGYENHTTRNAIAAQRWHIVANQVGSVGHAPDYGHARIVNPEGVVVADTGVGEGMVIAETDLPIPDPVVDFNGDGTVDVMDIDIMIDCWGTDDPLCDIGPYPWGDGIVDVEDLVVLVEYIVENRAVADDTDEVE